MVWTFGGAEVKPGTLVVVWRDNGEAFLTRTRGEPTIVPGITKEGIIYIEGTDSACLLSQVRPVTVHPSLEIVVPAILYP